MKKKSRLEHQLHEEKLFKIQFLFRFADFMLHRSLLISSNIRLLDFWNLSFLTITLVFMCVAVDFSMTEHALFERSHSLAALHQSRSVPQSVVSKFLAQVKMFDLLKNYRIDYIFMLDGDISLSEHFNFDVFYKYSKMSTINQPLISTPSKPRFEWGGQWFKPLNKLYWRNNKCYCIVCFVLSQLQ